MCNRKGTLELPLIIAVQFQQLPKIIRYGLHYAIACRRIEKISWHQSVAPGVTGIGVGLESDSCGLNSAETGPGQNF